MDEIMIPLKKYRKLSEKLGVLKDTNKKLTTTKDKYYKWWQEEEDKTKALEAEIETLKGQLEEMHNLVEGYKSSFVKEFGKEAADAES
jgi:hypothetical protein